MIIKYHFSNGNTADFFKGAFDKQGRQLVKYNGKMLSVERDERMIEPFICTPEMLLLEGSIERIAEREFKLYWRNDWERAQALVALRSCLELFPDLQLIGAGARSFKVTASLGASCVATGKYKRL